ncbi:Sua5/YciO/YrdC/YwlC family protein [Erwinia pyri]|uniref:L-threonylcarbamoyladenylate synthase n=1 Tax=Erwinia pyri TaxID=3062598 RepID=A0AA50DJF8_9GAMM|nr:Sua5/YciO/YrdC/YwlC family protein [Erwinia sp. DE2]WLS79029.1 Sua5/YciO/YrdC/YwlC family protein [Erwinia sp. DE2]
MSFIDLAVDCLKRDGVILVPTDTHYALAASPFSASAAQRLSEMKAQKTEQATLCVTGINNLLPWVTLNGWQREQLHFFAQRYWPGPLKFLLPKSDRVPENPLMSGSSVAVLCNHNSLLNATIDALGHPLMVLPASVTTASDGLVSMTAARDNFGALVDMVIPSNNRNQCSHATTFVSLLDNRVELLRRGDVIIEPEMSMA